MIDPGSLIVMAFVLAFFCALVCVAREVHSKKYRNRPDVILRRCRLELWALKRELKALPAGRGMHELMDTIGEAERTMDLVESSFSRGKAE